MTRRRLAILAAALLVGAAAAALLLGRGHGQRPQAPPVQTARSRRHVPRPSHPAFSWPVYGFDPARTHSAPLRLRPPFRTLWKVYGDSSFIEFPPVLAAGRLFFGTNHGLVLAVEAASGRIAWHRQFAGCIASSPAVGNGVVYIGFMDPPPCSGSAPSFLAALDARDGRTLWRFRAGVIETLAAARRRARLLRLVGPSGLRARRAHGPARMELCDRRPGEGRCRARRSAPSTPAPTTGTSMRSTRGAARLRWRAGGGRLGGLYATPSVAHGRVFVSSTNGRVYAFSLSGNELWSVQTGSYVYSPAALAGATAYVGSYDHRLYALSQATGRTRWTFDAGAPISGAPTVLGGLVYFSTCGSCSSYESNPRARRTFALDAATGRLVWRFPDGEYSPVIGDRERLYLTGFTSLYGLAPRGSG